MKCERCGCTDERACVVMGEPCAWVRPRLCTACATPRELAAALDAKINEKLEQRAATRLQRLRRAVR